MERAGHEQDRSFYLECWNGAGTEDAIYRTVNGSTTKIAGPALMRTPTTGDVMRFTVQGSLLKLGVLAGGVIVDAMQVTDTAISTAGYNGIGDDSMGATLDDYVLYEL